MKIFGVTTSPFVRKVLIALAEKGLEYETETLIPVNVPKEYLEIHPMGKIPALRDDGFTLPDSSAILVYLEGKQSEPSLFPDSARDRAQAVWLEEYADTKIAQTVNPNIYFQRLIQPNYFHKTGDEELVEKTITEALPAIFTYLEGQVSGAHPIVGERFSVADIALATQLVNLHHAGVPIDAKFYPQLSAYNTFILGRDSVKERTEADRLDFDKASRSKLAS